MRNSKKHIIDASASQPDEPGNKVGAKSEAEEDVTSSLELSPFNQDEKVLAYHVSELYPAKVLQAVYQMDAWKYFVHYIGWNKKWDEWRSVDQLVKHNDEKAPKHQDLESPNMDKNAKPGRMSPSKPKISNVARRKRKSDSLSKGKSTLSSEKLVNLHIPSILKKQLIDDCEFITRLGKLVEIPRTPNVDSILKNYLEYREKKEGMVADSVGEIINGLRSYFDKALPAMLLYSSEHMQYEEKISDDVSPSTIYGAEHLLRLFVKLPALLAHIKMEEETLKELQSNFVDFLKFLQKNRSVFFLSSYHPEDLERKKRKHND